MPRPRPPEWWRGAGRTGWPRLASGALIALSAAVPACAGTDAEAEADARAQLEMQFGRRGPSAPGGRGLDPTVRSVNSPASTPDGGAANSPPEQARADPPRVQRETGPAEAPPPARDRVGGGEAESPGPATDAASTDPTPDSVPGLDLPVRSEQGLDVDSLLRVADETYAGLRSLRAAFKQRIENPLIGRTREGSGIWFQAGRGRFRMDFADPPGDVIVADGTCLWGYEPSLHNQIVVSRLDEGAEIGTVDVLGRLLAEARTSYDGVYGGPEDVEGIPSHLVSLTPRESPSRYVSIHVWIGAADHLVRRFRIEEENRTIRTVTLSDLAPQVSIPNAIFEFTPPPGVPIFPDDVRCG